MTDGVGRGQRTEHTLVAIGFWRDRSESYWPNVDDFVDKDWDEADRALVAGRLRDGHQVRQFRGPSTCRVCGQPNGSGELSDGVYLWPEGLSHYVRVHGVRLPTPVEKHFLNTKTTPTPSDGWAEADDSWWLSLGSAEWA